MTLGRPSFPLPNTAPPFAAWICRPPASCGGLHRCESCHPAPDGTCPTIARDLELSIASFGADGPAWAKLARWQQAMGDRLVAALLAPLPGFGAALRLGPLASSAACFGWSSQLRRLFAASVPHGGRTAGDSGALALHVDLGPNDFSGAGLGLGAGAPGVVERLPRARSAEHGPLPRRCFDVSKKQGA